MNSKNFLAAVALVVTLALASLHPDMKGLFVNLSLSGLTIQTK